MHGNIDRKKIAWERASCRGLDTNIFYKARTELLEEGLSYGHLRRMCFSCPIWEECLRVGVTYEQFGFWGGLSEDERRHIFARKSDTKVINWLKRDLDYLKVAFGEIARVVLDNERDFTFNK
jgi:Transcription factor WhiB